MTAKKPAAAKPTKATAKAGVDDKHAKKTAAKPVPTKAPAKPAAKPPAKAALVKPAAKPAVKGPAKAAESAKGGRGPKAKGAPPAGKKEELVDEEARGRCGTRIHWDGRRHSRRLGRITPLFFDLRDGLGR